MNAIHRIRRALLLCWYRWQRDCLVDERTRYVEARACGPQYLHESDRQERVLRGRIAFLEAGIDL